MELPDIGRYRRRFIVEFGPEDSGLVDRMGVLHRTKRAAIIAGLRLLESGEVEGLRAQVAELVQELAQAKEALAGAQQGTAKAAPALATAKADLRAEKAAHARTKRSLASAQESLKDARTAVARADKSILALQAERDDLAGRLPDAVNCPSCDKFVPQTEWAEQPTATGIDVYHKRDGYRPTGTLLHRSTVLFRRRKPGQATR